jgi:hypothetical protein
MHLLAAAAHGLALAASPGGRGPEEPGEGLGYVVIVGAAVLYGIGYFISLRIHPYTACRSCKGAARKRGKVFSRSFGPCRACKGTGRRLRLGNRVFRGDSR